MTASEPRPGHGANERSLADLALDLLVYLPAGVVATALDDMDHMAAKGRSRVDQQLRNAHVVGRFAVDFGLRRMKRQAESLLASRTARPGTARPGTARPGTARPGTERGAPRTEPAATSSPEAPRPRSRAAAPRRRTTAPETQHPREPEVDRAIPDYDTLSASQVVRRLDGLDAHELRAIVRHELDTRGRRTILHRAEQLLEGAPPPAPGTPAGP